MRPLVTFAGVNHGEGKKLKSDEVGKREMRERKKERKKSKDNLRVLSYSVGVVWI